MTAPYLKDKRKPRQLLYSLTVVPVEGDLIVEQQWYAEDLRDGTQRTKILIGGRAKMPLTCTHEWDYTGGWYNMAHVLHYLGLPTRRVLVTEYAFKNAMEKSA